MSLSRYKTNQTPFVLFPFFAILLLAGIPAFAVPAVLPFGVNGDWDFTNLLNGGGWFSPTNDPNFNSDANGWPTDDAEITVIDARHNMAWNGPDWVGSNPIVAGTYQLILTGQAAVSANTEAGTTGVVVQNQEYWTPTNQTYAQIVLQPGYFLLQVTLSNTKRLPTDTPPTGFTNAIMVRPGDSIENTQPFTRATLKTYGAAPFAVTRMPDG